MLPVEGFSLRVLYIYLKLLQLKSYSVLNLIFMKTGFFYLQFLMVLQQISAAVSTEVLPNRRPSSFRHSTGFLKTSLQLWSHTIQDKK